MYLKFHNLEYKKSANFNPKNSQLWSMQLIPRLAVECEGCHSQLPSRRKSRSWARRTYWRSVASSKGDTSILVAWRNGCPHWRFAEHFRFSEWRRSCRSSAVHSAGIAFGQQLAYASSFIDGLKAKMLNVEYGGFAHSVDCILPGEEERMRVQHPCSLEDLTLPHWYLFQQENVINIELQWK